jgi:hypothetical protein
VPSYCDELQKWEKRRVPRYPNGSAGFAQEIRLERRQEINEMERAEERIKKERKEI